MKKLIDLRQIFREELFISQQESDAFFYILLEHTLGMKAYTLAMDTKKTINHKTLNIFLNTLKRLKSHEPIQYILGEATFLDLRIRVNTSVLIPRGETEEMVHFILQRFKYSDGLRVADLCTGSGCIAIALKKYLKKSWVCGIDISEEALQIASKSAELNQVGIDFLQEDILNIQKLAGTFDLIISNPPYVREMERSQMHPNVLDYEPHLALFVKDDNPLIFYSRIISLAIKSLREGGELFFESNEAMAVDLKEMMRSQGFKNLQIIKDIQEKNRIVFGSLVT